MVQQLRWDFGIFGIALGARSALAALATTCVQRYSGNLGTYGGGVPCGIVTPSSVSVSMRIEYGLVTHKHA